MSKYKIIMTGGGTAGHVTPNLALVPKLKEKGFDIKYIVTPTRICSIKKTSLNLHVGKTSKTL